MVNGFTMQQPQGGRIMVVQHNLRAMNSNRMLNITAGEQSKSSEKLSSGYRINRAADDAAGLSISEKMRSQVRGLNQASRNAQDGISFVQTVEGAYAEVTEMLQRMNELAIQAANGTSNTTQDGYIQNEVTALKEEIGRIGAATNFNGLGAFGIKMTFQIGEIHTANVTEIGISTGSIGNGSGDIDVSDIKVSNDSIAKASIALIQNHLESVSAKRSELGAMQNRLEHTVKNLDNISENTSAAESRIRDTDMSTEMVKYSNNQILAQAGQAMLAQSNQANQGVLSLLQ